MKLTVLGNNGPYPGANSACSGYVIEKEGKLVVLDMGSGCLSNFLKKNKIEDISFIVLSHLHFDHMSDVLVLRYALQIKGLQLDLYIPRTPEHISSVLKCDEFNITYIDDSLCINKDGFTVDFCKVTHPVETYAIRINGCFVYSGDLSEAGDLVEFLYGIDTLLIDSALLSKQKDDKKVFHLSAKECGMLAKKCKVTTMILTHFPSDADTNEYYIEASRYFNNTLMSCIMCEYHVKC